MIKKLSLIVLCTLSTSSFSAEGYNYRVLREEVYATPGLQYGMKHVPPRITEKKTHQLPLHTHEHSQQ